MPLLPGSIPSGPALASSALPQITHNKPEPYTSLLHSVTCAPAAAAVNSPHFVGL